jgi:hypothetical protein
LHRASSTLTQAASDIGGRGDAQPARRVKIIADGTDWRFLDELKRELKT